MLAILEATQSEPLSLVLIDTEKVTERIPKQTAFLLPPCIGDAQRMYILLERGMHEPSPGESLAPFHQDPSQRIAVLDIEFASRYLLVRVGVLLELGNRGVSEVGWDEWKNWVVIPSPHLGPPMPRSDVWVSGSRLFSVYRSGSGPCAQMEVYDFSVQGRAKYLSNSVDERFGGVRYLMPASEAGVRVQPWGEDTLKMCGGHDSLLFPTVSVTMSC